MKKNKTEMKEKILLVTTAALLFLLFLSANVVALGITPGRTTFNFEPSIEKEVKFKIINTEHKSMRVFVKAEGEWANQINLSQTEILFNENEYEKSLSYRIRFPLEGGVEGVKARIIAEEVPFVTGPGAFVGAKIAVEHQLYLITNESNLTQNISSKTGEINVTKVSVKTYMGEVANIEIEVFNFRAEPMENVYATMFIYDSLGNLKSQFNSSAEDIGPVENTTLVAIWDTKGFSLGNYGGNMVVHYDNKTIEQNLRITLEKDYIYIEFGEFEEKQKFPIPLPSQKIDKLNLTIIIIIVAVGVIGVLVILYLRKLSTLSNKKKNRNV